MPSEAEIRERIAYCEAEMKRCHPMSAMGKWLHYERIVLLWVLREGEEEDDGR